jgi:predicted PurR-regulated permease PerM
MESKKGANGTFLKVATLTLCVVALHFGKPVLMPVAVATLLAFLVAPVVNSLTRRKLQLPVAVAVVVILMFTIVAAAVWGLGSQIRAVAYELPDYKQNLFEKVADLRNASKGPALDRMRQTWRELRGELRKAPAAQTNSPVRVAGSSTNAPAPEREPVPVVVQGQEHVTIWSLPTALGPLVEIFATAFFIFVLVIFMLLRKRELRNRIILLFGYTRIPTTTRALDEAAERISRYLLMQTLVNGAYGTAVGVSLYLLSLPYALLWGLLAAALRFIPYVGVWLGASMPFLLSLAVFPGWLHAFEILGLIAVLELINNMYMEPRLYGHSAGVSEVALLVAVAFWTWVWGPIGLALATPLTVCLVVLAKYVPGLSFLSLLMGDEKVMEPPMEFYQRLLAMDEVESADIATHYRKEHELIEVYDELFLPALISARRDYLNEKLSDEHLDFIINTTGQLITKLGHHERSKAVADPAAAPREAQEVFAIPVEDTIDELVMAMLGHVLPEFVTLRAVSTEALSGEIMEQLSDRKPRVVCIGAIVPGGWQEMRHLLKRIQTAFPNMPVVVARWGLQSPKRERELLRATSAQAVSTTLKSAQNYIVQLLQLAAEPPLTLDFAEEPQPVAHAGQN